MIFALVGNQNCGKTTLFNALTGSNQHVGNFPGVTVDQKTGEIRGEKGCSVVDLPGIYSLRPYTQEEIVSRDYILNQKPDGIINIVDATNIERKIGRASSYRSFGCRQVQRSCRHPHDLDLFRFLHAQRQLIAAHADLDGITHRRHLLQSDAGTGREPHVQQPASQRAVPTDRCDDC